ncbi:MAG: ParB/RepB/Spo0J family partition protein [Acidimicrobiales bacterium]
MADSLDHLLGLGGSGEPEDQPPDVPVGHQYAVIPVGAIAPNARQPRRQFDTAELAALARSIGQLGVLQPILVRHIDADRYELIAGERRWRAAAQAGLRSVPALVRDVDDQLSLEEAIVENLHRADLNPLEEAAAYQQLIEEFALTQDEVAQRVGRSRSAVANLLRLFQLPTTVQRLVAGGSLSAGHARALLALTDPAMQAELARRVIEHDLSVRQLEALVRQDQGGSRRRSNRGPDRPPGLLEVETGLADSLDTRVRVQLKAGRGRVTLEFADLEDLDRIYRLLRRGIG